MKKFLSLRENEWIVPLFIAVTIVVLQVFLPLTQWANSF